MAIAVDPLWSKVALLIDGEEGLVDQSPYEHPILSYGNASLATSSHFGGRRHLYCGGGSGSGFKINVPVGDILDFAKVKAWCIEGKIAIISRPAVGYVFNLGGGLDFAWASASLSVEARLAIALNSTSGRPDIANFVHTNKEVVFNEEIDFAMVRDGGTINLYVNGSVVYSNSSVGAKDIYSFATAAGIGLLSGWSNQNAPAEAAYARLSMFRITVDSPRYTSQYEPPVRYPIGSYVGLRHKKYSNLNDGPNVDQVNASDWNDEHLVVGAANGSILFADGAGRIRPAASGVDGQFIGYSGGIPVPMSIPIARGRAGASSDLLSDLMYSELPLAGDAQLEFGCMQVCADANADYTVTLPPAEGNAGKLVGVRMANDLKVLVTLKPSASESIDGFEQRVMWANESAILFCDGANWVKLAGRSVPMMAVMYQDYVQQIAQVDDWNRVLLNKVLRDNTASLAAPMTDTANGVIWARRAGLYRVSGCVNLKNVSAGYFIGAGPCAVTSLAEKIGKMTENPYAWTSSSGCGAGPLAGRSTGGGSADVSLAVGDLVNLIAYVTNPGVTTTNDVSDHPHVTVHEMVDW